MGNKSNTEKEYDRRTILATYLYDVSKLLISGVGIGGLSPIMTGDELCAENYLCLGLGSIAAFGFAYAANSLLRIQTKKINYYGIIDFCFCNLCRCRMGPGNFPSYGAREKMGK